MESELEGLLVLIRHAKLIVDKSDESSKDLPPLMEIYYEKRRSHLGRISDRESLASEAYRFLTSLRNYYATSYKGYIRQIERFIPDQHTLTLELAIPPDSLKKYIYNLDTIGILAAATGVSIPFALTYPASALALTGSCAAFFIAGKLMTRAHHRNLHPVSTLTHDSPLIQILTNHKERIQAELGDYVYS